MLQNYISSSLPLSADNLKSVVKKTLICHKEMLVWNLDFLKMSKGSLWGLENNI